MPSTTEITVSQLSRLIGLPNSPAIIDIRADEDFASDPRLIPGSQRRVFSTGAPWARDYVGGSVILVCNEGSHLSQGVGAWMRQQGIDAQTLEGGYEAWRKSCQMLVRATKLSSRWRRLTEERSGSAKSVFHFDVEGSVAKSTHAGIPWLRFIRQRLGERVHFWPFDGWDIPGRRSAIAEVYPRLWSRGFASENRTGDQHDAYSIAGWLRQADHDGSLSSFLKPVLTPSERTVALVEGWILGVPGLIQQPVRGIPRKAPH